MSKTAYIIRVWDSNRNHPIGVIHESPDQVRHPELCHEIALAYCKRVGLTLDVLQTWTLDHDYGAWMLEIHFTVSTKAGLQLMHLQLLIEEAPVLATISS